MKIATRFSLLNPRNVKIICFYDVRLIMPQECY
ncbi:hypothetical protein EHW99_2549 [Erwinia amylovora]|uniref:Uncharacterized protein n=3 Tax=Erwinia amylovora TaxID=552 RepID=A0A830ZRE2_ERWAM|nr:hypothetical protein EaACW_1041 [Erwinia amylovora ACW56400]QJQ55251.1 hypothetical protein EHX00_2549 [Erwinia amylovora]CBA19981.1 hypothetical protein predicted by Glimmer/Critica [Erwinia amylovora CFBP1430]CBX79880.1 hypothetical protein predicted by Glimmer/Critica [Erwinia amylovora ATCC BAA-2158]CCO77883.1 hypothetical protein BN432_1061 [Erwinia amylovora Ea356]CCO81671.1 hypothetical protein BN433_1076 [Erwinia amylovora Ea266]CCO85472.1 hypothetical protein BN434_1060 [Erwinia a